MPRPVNNSRLYNGVSHVSMLLLDCMQALCFQISSCFQMLESNVLPARSFRCWSMVCGLQQHWKQSGCVCTCSVFTHEDCKLLPSRMCWTIMKSAISLNFKIAFVHLRLWSCNIRLLNVGFLIYRGFSFLNKPIFHLLVMCLVYSYKMMLCGCLICLFGFPKKLWLYTQESVTRGIFGKHLLHSLRKQIVLSSH